MEGREEAAGGEHEGSLRQEGPSVVHPVQISSGHVSHADRSGRTVQELVAIPVAVVMLLIFLIYLSHLAGLIKHAITTLNIFFHGKIRRNLNNKLKASCS